MNKKHYDKIFEDFKEECPGLVSKVDHWDAEGTNTIKIYFKNGTVNIYNYILKGLMPVHQNDGTEEDWRRDFRDKLVEKMADCDYTQQELAYATGISQTMIGRYLNKQSMPSGYVVAKLAKALHCSPDELIWFEGD